MKKEKQLELFKKEIEKLNEQLGQCAELIEKQQATIEKQRQEMDRLCTYIKGVTEQQAAAEKDDVSDEKPAQPTQR